MAHVSTMTTVRLLWVDKEKREIIHKNLHYTDICKAVDRDCLICPLFHSTLGCLWFQVNNGIDRLIEGGKIK